MIVPLELKSQPKMIQTEKAVLIPDPSVVRSWVDKLFNRSVPMVTRKMKGETQYNKIIVEGSMVRGKVLSEVSLGGFTFKDLQAVESRGRPNLWTCSYSHFEPDHLDARPSTF